MPSYQPVSVSKKGSSKSDKFLSEEPDYDFLAFASSAADDDDNDDTVDGGDAGRSSQDGGHPSSDMDYPPTNKPSSRTEEEQYTQYILGTLLVRLVAARDVRPVYNTDTKSSGGGGGGGGNDNHGLLGSLIDTVQNAASGGRKVTPRQPNPYGLIQFLGQGQRTSQLYDTTNPKWNRSEEYYFDVTLPVPNLALDGGDDDAGAGDYGMKTSGRKKNGKRQQQSAPPRIPPCPPPILSVSLLHTERTSRSGGGKKLGKTVNDAAAGFDEEEYRPPTLLGIASIDLRPVLTGKSPTVDQWIPLFLYNEDDDESNEEGGRRGQRQGQRQRNSPPILAVGEVRIVCEYEPTDPPPRVGDLCRLTGYCRPRDAFPIPSTTNVFLVDDIPTTRNGGSNNADMLLLSYTSPEGWVCTFVVHRYMVICAVRHQAALELYHDQIVDVADKLVHSPLVETVVDVVRHRVPEDGLVNVGVEGLVQGMGLVSRWFSGGVDTVAGDVLFAINWEGSHRNKGPENNDDDDDGEEEEADDDEEGEGGEDFILGTDGCREDIEGPDEVSNRKALPGMPSCPITGQAMIDPVVASDGHTYERSAIIRWMSRSDTSPLTGGRLPHRELVPNYLLISSLSTMMMQQQQQAEEEKKKMMSGGGSPDRKMSPSEVAGCSTPSRKSASSSTSSSSLDAQDNEMMKESPIDRAKNTSKRMTSRLALTPVMTMADKTIEQEEDITTRGDEGGGVNDEVDGSEDDNSEDRLGRLSVADVTTDDGLATSEGDDSAMAKEDMLFATGTTVAAASTTTFAKSQDATGGEDDGIVEECMDDDDDDDEGSDDVAGEGSNVDYLSMALMSPGSFEGGPEGMDYASEGHSI